MRRETLLNSTKLETEKAPYGAFSVDPDLVSDQPTCARPEICYRAISHERKGSKADVLCARSRTCPGSRSHPCGSRRLQLSSACLQGFQRRARTASLMIVLRTHISGECDNLPCGTVRRTGLQHPGAFPIRHTHWVELDGRLHFAFTQEHQSPVRLRTQGREAARFKNSAARRYPSGDASTARPLLAPLLV